MEMLAIAVLLGLSLTLVLTAKILKMRDLSYKMFLRLGVLSCVAAGAPLFIFLIPIAREDPRALFTIALTTLAHAVYPFIAPSAKGEIVPPCVPVTKPGLGPIARTSKEVAKFLLMGFVFYFAVRGSLPSVGQMSGWDMVAFGFFTMAPIIENFRSLFQRVEICGNGLQDGGTIKPWEAFESFSWTGVTTDGVELRLQAKTAGDQATRLTVRPEDHATVQQMLETKLPDQLSGAHDGLNRWILPRCVRVRRTRRRRFARHMLSALCWPAVVLLLVYLWKSGASLESFSGLGAGSIMIIMGINFWPSEIIEICRNGLLLGDTLRAWEQYECFFWKGETKDGVELRLPSKPTDWNSMTRLVVAPEDRAAVQQLLEVHLQDRSTDSEAYSEWYLF